MAGKDYTKNEGCASAVAVILALVTLALAGVLCGCRAKRIATTEYREVPVVLHDTVISGKWSHDTLVRTIEMVDTVLLRDSIVCYVDSSGVVHKEKYSTRATTRNRNETSNASSNKGSDTDKSNDKPVVLNNSKTFTETKEVNRLHWWQKCLMAIGGAVLVAIIGVAVWRRAK